MFRRLFPTLRRSESLFICTQHTYNRSLSFTTRRSLCTPAGTNTATERAETPHSQEACSTTTDYERVKTQLKSDNQYRITYEDFWKMTEQMGIAQGDAQRLLDRLMEEQLIVKLPSVEKYLFVQPKRVTDHLLEVLDPSGALNREKIAVNNERLETYLEEKDRLDRLKEQIEKRADKSATRILWGLAGGAVMQGAIIARLTWWDLSWDIMEPVTYLLTFFSSVIFLGYFQRYRLDFSYGTLRGSIHQRRRVRFYRRARFDGKSYEHLCQTIQNIQDELIELGQPVSEIPQYPLVTSPLGLDATLPPPPLRSRE